MLQFKLIFAALIILFSCLTLPAGEVNRVESGNLVLENIPDIPQELKDRLLQYQNVRSASFADWDPQSSGILISTRFAETSQIHLVTQPLGMRRQITFFPEPVDGGDFCRVAGKYGFLFTKDIGGNEFTQIFYYDMLTGSHQMLTDGTSRNTAPKWSNSGSRFSFSSTKRNGRDFDVYVSDMQNPQSSSIVLEKQGMWAAVEWSPDDKNLLITNYVSANESYYYIFDLNSKELAQMNPSKKKIAYGGAMFSKDGKGIYYTSDEDTEFRHLRYYNLSTKKSTILTKDIPWDVEEGDLSDDGSKLAFLVNEDGISKLHLLQLPSMQELKLPELPVGVIGGISFSPDSKRLALTIYAATGPGDVFIISLDDLNLQRWTESEVGGLNSATFVSPQLIHFPTFDKVNKKPREIPAFLYKPDKAGKKFPVIIDIHGGPEGQEQPTFSSLNQFFVNELGIAVIAPNVRGSSGYGKTYLMLDNGFKREESLQDIGKLLDWIAAQPDLDADRVAVFGGSYGGYMVLSSMVNFNDRLRCGIDVVGISNFVTFLNNTQEYRRDLRRVEYGDEKSPNRCLWCRGLMIRAYPPPKPSRLWPKYGRITWMSGICSPKTRGMASGKNPTVIITWRL